MNGWIGDGGSVPMIHRPTAQHNPEEPSVAWSRVPHCDANDCVERYFTPRIDASWGPLTSPSASFHTSSYFS